MLISRLTIIGFPTPLSHPAFYQNSLPFLEVLLAGFGILPENNYIQIANLFFRLGALLIFMIHGDTETADRYALWRESGLGIPGEIAQPDKFIKARHTCSPSSHDP